jgi:HSP20 family protein
MKNPLAILPQTFRRRMPTALKAMAEMENEMNRLFQSSTAWPEEFESFDFSPACDLREDNKQYVAQFDIPGIKKDEVKIELENGRLTVSGERKDKKEEKDAKHYLSESYYGSFLRSFSLPSAVDEAKIDAHYEDGVLTIKIPKLATSKAKEIKIH